MKDINQDLRPFVKEMLQYSMDIFGQKDKRTIQCILFGVVCVLPAGRKSLLHLAVQYAFPGSVGCNE